MSIITSVKVYDGLVIAADSMTQIVGEDHETGEKSIIKTYKFAKKLFQISDLPVALATYGIGNIGTRSIESLLFGFCRKNYNDNKNIQTGQGKVKEIAKCLLNYFKEQYEKLFDKYSSENKPILGFYVGGYSPDSPYAEDWEFILPDFEDIREVRPIDHFGASWRGTTLPFTRLYRGIDPRGEQLLISEGVSEDTVKKLHTAFESPIIFDGMPVQDAIDLAKFIVETIIGLSRFEIGPQTCGGPLDIAVILPDRKFTWIQQKSLEGDKK